ncbi:unnamed protein product [Eretmochelys imbricata]
MRVVLQKVTPGASRLYELLSWQGIERLMRRFCQAKAVPSKDTEEEGKGEGGGGAELRL